MYPSEQLARFQVRMPHSLRDWLKEKAKASHRSMNGELISVLERASEADKQNQADA